MAFAASSLTNPTRHVVTDSLLPANKNIVASGFASLADAQTAATALNNAPAPPANWTTTLNEYYRRARLHGLPGWYPGLDLDALDAQL